MLVNLYYIIAYIDLQIDCSLRLRRPGRRKGDGDRCVQGPRRSRRSLGLSRLGPGARKPTRKPWKKHGKNGETKKNIGKTMEKS